MAPGYVYLLNVVGTSFYKVGITSGDPNDRLRTLQTGNANELRLVEARYQENPQSVEQSIHQYLAEYRVRGEWFETELALIHDAYTAMNTMAVVDFLFGSAGGSFAAVQAAHRPVEIRVELRQTNTREQLREQVVQALRTEPTVKKSDLARKLGVGRTLLYGLIADARTMGELPADDKS